MFENLKKGWAIGKATRKLVFEDRDLFMYPLVSALAVVLEVVAIFLPSALFLNNPALQYYNLLSLFAVYMVVTFTSTYIIMAMFIAFRSFISGKKISFGEAFSQVKPYAALILEWSIFYSIVLIAVRILESRLRGIAGLFLGAALSIALSLSTLFVVPVILDEKLGPIAALKSSASFIIKNFGQSFGGLIYADLYSLAIAAVGILIVFAGLASALFVNFFLGVVIGIVGFSVFVIGIMIGYLLSNLFKLILYDFIKYDRIPKGFTGDMLKSSTRTKNSKMNGFVPGNI